MGDDDLTVGSLPPWFRRWGVGAWLVVGMALVVVAAVELLSLTSSIVGPLIGGAVIGAIVMALIIFLANGPLQQVVQPIVFGATLQLNPLVVFRSRSRPAPCSGWWA